MATHGPPITFTNFDLSKANDSWIVFSPLDKAFLEVSYFTNRVIPLRLPSGHDLLAQVLPINILQMLRNLPAPKVPRRFYEARIVPQVPQVLLALARGGPFSL